MKVEIYRKIETDLSTIGEMYVDGQFECFTLEPARENPVHPGHPLVAAGGPFKILLTMSNHLVRKGLDGQLHTYVTPEVQDVPGRSAIRWHIGNFPKDTLGCVLVGVSKGEDFVGESAKAFDRLMVLLKIAADKAESITAEYFDPR